MAKKCDKKDHEGVQILCINNKCLDYLQQWTCSQCYNNNYYGDHRHFVDQPTDRYKTHFKSEKEFQYNFQKINQIMQDSILKIEKEDHQINQRINYLRKMLDDFETYKCITVDNLKQQLYRQILYIQNLSYYDLTRNEIKDLQKIQESSVCNYENYIYHNLSNTASQLADILATQMRQLKEQISQINIKNQEKLENLFSQQEQHYQKKETKLIEVRTMSMSFDEKYIMTGGDGKQLALFKVQNQQKIQIQDEEINFDKPIRIVDFLRAPVYPYQIAVLSDKIKIYEIDIKKQKIFTEIKTIEQKNEGKDIKSIQFIDESHLIIIGKVETFIYNIYSNKVIQNTTLKITDIDICQIQNKILIGYQNGLFYLGDFMINGQISSTIFALSSNSIQKQQDPITQVKMQRNVDRFLTCHTKKYDDKLEINHKNNYIKVWNFLCEEIFQLQANFLHANFVGQKQLFIIFSQETYQIFNYNHKQTPQPQASRIIGDKTKQLQTQCQSIIRDEQQLTSIYLIENKKIKRYLEDVNVFSNQCMSQFTPLETEQI